MSKTSRTTRRSGKLYRTIWRWHFYAGLLVLPVILVLSVTGAVYLFKPQVDRWEERAFQSLPASGAVSADRQLAAVLAAHPDARWNHYRLPARPGDAALIQLTMADGRPLQVFVSPQGRVLGQIDPENRIEEIVARIHGSLLLGRWGDWLVELAASWTIVLIVSGLYLWWPRPLRASGTLWPRLGLRGRPLLKDIHRVTGFWIAGLVLVTLASGLPWAGAWGTAFGWVREELGLVQGPRTWKIGAEVKHHHAATEMAVLPPAHSTGLPLSAFVAKANAERMDFPVLVLPPHAQPRFGPPAGDVWTVKSETQDRPLARQVSYDPRTGAETSRRGWADAHVVDRIVNTGIAWHEGQLFGLANQVIGLLTACGLIAVSILGTLMWLRRRPTGRMGAPPRDGTGMNGGMILLLAALALLLPLFAASLLVIAAVDWMLRIAGRLTIQAG